jgi:alpha-2-macroglobulin
MGATCKSLSLRYLPLLCAAGALLSCGRGGTPGGAVPSGVAGGAVERGVVQIPPLPLPRGSWGPDRRESEPGLTFRLRESARPAAAPPTPVVPAAGPAAVLGARETATLLARLPALPVATAEPFRFPAASPPPQRTGRVVLSVFPPPAETVPAEAVPALPRPAPGPVAPLAVQRIVPDGETELAAHVTITFSDAMVPLTTVAGTAAVAPPARLVPQPPGRWMWLDTRTLRFEPEGRLPMATEYTVEVPAGVRSAAGEALKAPVRATFATPAPRALGAYPALRPLGADVDRLLELPPGVYRGMQETHDAAASVALEPVLVVVFDQRVVAAAVLRSARLLADGRAQPVRLAQPAEVAADSVARLLTEQAEPGRWVALRPVRPLPRDADVRLHFAAGLVSAEGPRTTAQAQEARFRTYGPLRIARHRCGWDDECRPGAPWQLELTNELDAASWSDALVSVEPALPEMSVQASGRTIVITGASRAQARYRVTLSPAVRDRFGQGLEPPRSVTFDVGAPQPSIALAGGPLIVLDPDGPARVRVQAQGHAALRARVYRASPSHWPAYGDALQAAMESHIPGRRLQPPGTLVLDTVLRPAGGGAQYTELLVDVARALDDGLGHAIVLVEPAGAGAVDAVLSRQPGRRPPAIAWVQGTRLGLSAAVDRTELLAWATSLRSGAPLPGVAVWLVGGGARQTTAADGTARLPLPSSPAAVLVAAAGRDTALLPQNPWAGRRSGWQARADAGELRWFVLSDRGLYLPGETVHVKGWLRHVPPGPRLELALPRNVASVAFQIRGPRGEELGAGTLRQGGLGGFSTAVELPAALNLGQAWFQLTAEGSGLPDEGRQAHHHVGVQEFRRPDYEVRVDADPGPHVVGDVVAFDLDASYYGGGGLGGARVEWRVATGPGHYTPPGWDGWQFGRGGWWGYPPPAAEGEESLVGATDAGGRHRVEAELLSVEPPFASMLRVAAEVHDVTRQAGSATTQLLVHPAALNVGLRAARAWANPGEPVRVDVIVVDHDGRPVPGREPEIVLERAVAPWMPRPVPSAQAPTSAQGDGRVVCRVVSAADPVACTMTVDSGGSYRLRADVRDGAGRVSRTELMLWVAGTAGPPRQHQEPGRIEIVADRDEYQPGDTARLAVQVPFRPAEALVTVRGNGVLSTERWRIDDATGELRVPVTDAHLGGITVDVELVDAAQGIRWGRGSTELKVPPRQRALAVRVLPRDTVTRPGAETVLEVEVRGADGRAVDGAEVALWMVDEAVLGLGGYTLADPLEVLHGRRQGWTQAHQNRRWVVVWPRSAGPGTLSGVVLGAGGSALPRVAVALEGTDIAGTTAFDGSFTLRGVGTGEHVLRLRAPDGTAGSRRIAVPAEGAHLGSIILGDMGITIAATTFDAVQLRAAGLPAAAAPPPPPMQMDAAMRLESVVVTGAAGEPVDVRAEFAPLAVFEPSLRTGPDGRARVTVRLPGSLTRYRVMAVAAAGADRFGTGEATVTARQDLMARITAPRFLNHGDAFELPVLVQNATTAPLTVDVAVRAAGLEIEGAGRRITLPAGGRAELRYPARATQAGVAHVQVIAAAAGAGGTAAAAVAVAAANAGGAALPVDAAQASIPVLTPATMEAFAVYGTLDDDAPVVLPLARPEGVIPGFGGLEVGITSTALHALTDAVLYLHAYPFEGAEHIASRVLAVAALRDVLTAFAAEGLPPAAELEAATARDVARLASLQHGDGGWPFWPGAGESHPFVSMHVAHALQRAQEKDFAVPATVLQQAVAYLRTVDRHVARWPLAARQSAYAYSLYVRHRLGDGTAAEQAVRLARATPAQVGGELPVEAVAWLLPVLAGEPAYRGDAAELRRVLLNRAVETPAGVTFAERYTDGAELLLHSRLRTDALVLEALLAADPQNDLVPKLAQTLLARRTAGRWSGTQENAWALLALDRYFRTYEATTPAFASRVWLGDRFAGSHAFRGRTTDRQHIAVPMPQLLRADAPELVIAREGTGRLYYRAGLRYAPADTRVPPLDRGFTVSRTYEAVDEEGDVVRNDDGTWRVRAGARVRVRVQVVAPSVRFHVALVDPLPAGLEPLNPELRGAGITDDRPERPVAPARGAAPRPPGAMPPPVWHGQWFTHQNLRDDRAEVFATVLSAGSWEYTYLARATTPGTFVVPPPRAEMMYEPEVFGRGAGTTLVVEGGGR